MHASVLGFPWWQIREVCHVDYGPFATLTVCIGLILLGVAAAFAWARWRNAELGVMGFTISLYYPLLYLSFVMIAGGLLDLEAVVAVDHVPDITLVSMIPLIILMICGSMHLLFVSRGFWRIPWALFYLYMSATATYTVLYDLFPPILGSSYVLSKVFTAILGIAILTLSASFFAKLFWLPKRQLFRC